MHILVFGGFRCSQAHIFLAFDPQDPKDNFSPIKKILHLDQNWFNGPLNIICPLLNFQCIIRWILETSSCKHPFKADSNLIRKMLSLKVVVSMGNRLYKQQPAYLCVSSLSVYDALHTHLSSVYRRAPCMYTYTVHCGMSPCAGCSSRTCEAWSSLIGLLYLCNKKFTWFTFRELPFSHEACFFSPVEVLLPSKEMVSITCSNHGATKTRQRPLGFPSISITIKQTLVFSFSQLMK